VIRALPLKLFLALAFDMEFKWHIWGHSFLNIGDRAIWCPNIIRRLRSL